MLRGHERDPRRTRGLAGGTGCERGACAGSKYKVTFPRITRVGSPSRAFEFKVTCEARTADDVKVIETRSVFSPNAYQAESRDTAMCWCNFPADHILNTEETRFVVAPLDCWGNAGKPIDSAWQRRR